MRMRSVIGQHSGRGSGAGVNVTPMIDVVMCLIVFYLMVGQLALDRRSTVIVAQTNTGIQQQDHADVIEISVHSDGRLTLNAEPIEIERIAGEVAGIKARRGSSMNTVRIRADEQAGFGMLRPVLFALQEAGIGGVEFVTLRKNGSGS